MGGSDGVCQTKKKDRRFRSNLEVDCAAALEAAHISYGYEPFSIPLIDSVIYEPESWEKIGKAREFKVQRTKVQPITYTPDFVGKD